MSIKLNLEMLNERKNKPSTRPFFSFAQHEHMSIIKSIMMYSLISLVTLILAFAVFNYMETGVPEGVPEVWNARILDTSLRTMGKVVRLD